ncbi:MAG TPA: CrcB family protein [Mycobacteriales bacterium]|nr:CrcB family protein [Mycobacteriales bacterium]
MPDARPLATLGAIAAGGALGAPARYELGLAWTTSAHGFPWATFTANVSGCFLLGVLLVLVLERWPPTRYVRPFAAIGFVGAYTTWSTFVVEMSLLTKDGHGGLAVAYGAASLAAGLVATVAGMRLARAGHLGPQPGEPIDPDV